MKIAEAFNQSWFSRFINSSAGRVFRLVVGTGFLVVGYLFREQTLGVIAMVFSILPLSAGCSIFAMSVWSWAAHCPEKKSVSYSGVSSPTYPLFSVTLFLFGIFT